MKVLIISTNRNRQPVSVLPLGACLVAEAARAAGHAVRMEDLMFESDPRTAVERALNEFAPDVVGISVRNIDNNDLNDTAVYFKELPDLVHMVEKMTKAKTVLGGAAVGVMPEELLRYSGALMCDRGQRRRRLPAASVGPFTRRVSPPAARPGLAGRTASFVEIRRRPFRPPTAARRLISRGGSTWTPTCPGWRRFPFNPSGAVPSTASIAPTP